MLIKIILIFFFIFIASYLMRTNLGAKETAWRRLAMLGFCVAAIVAVALPRITTQVANLMGVGRGADLLMYTFVVVFLFSQLNAAKEKNEQERRLTKLAREIALNQALIAEHKGRNEASKSD